MGKYNPFFWARTVIEDKFIDEFSSLAWERCKTAINQDDTDFPNNRIIPFTVFCVQALRASLDIIISFAIIDPKCLYEAGRKLAEPHDRLPLMVSLVGEGMHGLCGEATRFAFTDTMAIDGRCKLDLHETRTRLDNDKLVFVRDNKKSLPIGTNHSHRPFTMKIMDGIVDEKLGVERLCQDIRVKIQDLKY